MIEGDLSDRSAIERGVERSDAVFHVAAVYKVGIPASEREAMHEANVAGTERVLDAAQQAGVARVVYVSTGNVYGNTKGQVVDEAYRPPAAARLPLAIRPHEVRSSPARARADREGRADRDRDAWGRLRAR